MESVIATDQYRSKVLWLHTQNLDHIFAAMHINLNSLRRKGAPGRGSFRLNGRPAAASALEARQKVRSTLSGAALRKRRCTRRPSGNLTATRQPPGPWASVSGGRAAAASCCSSSGACSHMEGLLGEPDKCCGTLTLIIQ